MKYKIRKPSNNTSFVHCECIFRVLIIRITYNMYFRVKDFKDPLFVFIMIKLKKNRMKSNFSLEALPSGSFLDKDPVIVRHRTAR